MTKTTTDTATRILDWIIDIEDGLVDDPSDPGGLTKYGISQRSYPDLDIAALTEADARAIYVRDFLGQYLGLPWPLSLLCVDAAVQHGPHVPVSHLQQAANRVYGRRVLAVDGDLGPLTLTAVRSLPAWPLAMQIVSLRVGHYLGLRTWPAHGKGWARRIAGLMGVAGREEEK
jgi:lysozyme family protein